MKKNNSKNKPTNRNQPKRKSPQSDFFKKTTLPKKTTPKTGEKTEVNPNPRLNKYVANAGIASRRKADELIKEGNVSVNDEVILAMGYRVQPDDVVRFQGKIIKPETRKVYILLNKPKNTITTASDPQGRKTVLDMVGKACPERIFPVGRLDRNTTGLLLVTNDGDLAKKLSHPSHKVKKIYHVYLGQAVTLAHLSAIAAGLELEDGKALVDKVGYLDGKTKEIGIELHIGKNRIVRRIFAHLGYEVIRLDRVYYGGLTKKDLPRGKYRFLEKREVIMLKHFV